MSEIKPPVIVITLDEVGKIPFESTLKVTRSRFLRSIDFVHLGEMKRITTYVQLKKDAKDSGTFSVQVALTTPGKSRALLNRRTEEVVKIVPTEFERAVQTAWKEHLATIGTNDPA